MSRMSPVALAALSLFCLAPLRGEAKPFNLSGTWSYSTQGSWKKGPCPTGGEAKGELKITQKGETLTLVFVSGRTCRPASVCTFKGKVTGDRATFANSTKVDNEGGTVSNEIVLDKLSNKAAEGKSSSAYRHPGGMSCTWGSKIRLTRK